METVLERDDEGVDRAATEKEGNHECHRCVRRIENRDRQRERQSGFRDYGPPRRAGTETFAEKPDPRRTETAPLTRLIAIR